MKPHFIPLRYRVLGGLLQSMNIKFGNFLEEVISSIVENEKIYNLLPESGKKNGIFQQSRKATEFIDDYIIEGQNNVYNEKQLDYAFSKCLKEIRKLENEGPYYKTKHDIDLFFYDKINNAYIYCEIKYNDDHDTGKFVDINRKFLMTYSLLVHKYNENIQPFLFYFTKKRLKGNPYIPETNIFRGDEFFNKYTQISYSDIDDCFKNISESPEVNQKFDIFASEILHRKISSF